MPQPVPPSLPGVAGDASGPSVAPDLTLPALSRRLAEAAKALAGALNLEPAGRERLRAAVVEAGQPPAVVASRLALAPDEAIAAASASLHDAPLWDGPPPAPIAGPAALNDKFLAENYALVLDDSAERLEIGLVDAGSVELRRGVQFAAGKPVSFRTVPFNLWRAARTAAVAAQAGAAAEADLAQDAERLRDFASDAPVVRYLDGLLERALQERASDIHLEQKADRCLVRFRIDGDLRDVDPLSSAFGAGVIARIKVLADLDVASVRAPQDGRATAAIRGAPTDLRISTTPTVFGESAVVRLLVRHGLDFTVDSLGFDQGFRDSLSQQLRKPYGLILVTGPTGSGKTTTLYAALRRLATRQRKVLTIEDPIEYVFDGINQTQVNEAAGVTFASALRAFLRHDPDVILVGEIRDSETAHLAVQAALTGHLVLATLHTNDAATAPARLADMGVERYLLAGVLIGASAQRLAPKLCEACKTPRTMTAEEGALFSAHGVDPAGARLHEAAGCRACAGTGRAGRLPLGEIFTVDETVERMISTGAPTADIRHALAAQPAFRPLAQDALSRAAAGEVSLDDVFRAVGL
ncbi:general secretion pathway protein E [Caulobacter ginsengisoli]|uniref:General secretion pathway protein E n=1 Tax=Caulobacter ginsengisoli TaxID=400775 RepID=A0ABU0IUQ1_9CAUL|nr:GspE/PulE family protein [Caulobacter ginsengisoli]MDQ0465745.1 general secretion pathway protein E [Caulobacter ginsengisoli]